jgi:hypothetical protein
MTSNLENASLINFNIKNNSINLIVKNMGHEIVSCEGVVFTLDEVLSKLMPKLSSNSCLSVAIQVKEKLHKHFLERYTGDRLVNVSSRFMTDRLQEIKCVSQLEEWLKAVFQKCAGEAGDGGLLDNEEELLLVWETLAGVNEFAGLPAYVDFYYFNSWRDSGGDVPSGEVLIVFEDSSLFESRLSQRGKDLATLLDQESLSVSTFSRLSY